MLIVGELINASRKAVKAAIEDWKRKNGRGAGEADTAGE